MVRLFRCFTDMVWCGLSLVAAFQIELLVFRRKASDLLTYYNAENSYL